MDKEVKERLFYLPAEAICESKEKELLKYALGASLYIPAMRAGIASMIIDNKYPQIVSMVICLEDSISDYQVAQAEEQLINNLKIIDKAIEEGNLLKIDLPFIFIRVRTPEHFIELSGRLEKYSSCIKGFVFPKFDIGNSVAYLNHLQKINMTWQDQMYFMPILESENVIYKEKRIETLIALKDILNRQKEYLLTIRIGATDFCSLFGIRRGKDYTVYQIQVIRDCIADIINVFNRYEDNFVVSGSVWEYFNSNERLLKPLLRATPFNEDYGEKGLDLRSKLIALNLDGLIRETLEDKENGIIGKTVIHPSHISLVNALYVVTHEEYMDALEIIEGQNCGGVCKSQYNNKMNEIKPHTLWAKKILLRAKVYGVFNEGYDCLTLISQKFLEMESTTINGGCV